MPMPRFWRSAAMLAMSEMTIPNWLNNYAISDIVNIAVGSELYKERSSSSRRPSCTARWPLEIPVYTLGLAARQHTESPLRPPWRTTCLRDQGTRWVEIDSWGSHAPGYLQPDLPDHPIT
eukprot:scaffold54221_cov55-Phaeocystis_antarctica.AAC.5